MIPDLAALRRSGAISALDDHFARTVVGLCGESRAEVVLAAALASRQVAAGHVCLDLPRLLEEGFELEEDARVAWQWPPLEAWLAVLGESESVESGAPSGAPAQSRGEAEGAGRGSAPLVLDEAGRLYLRRYWEYQRQLTHSLRTRLGVGQGAVEIDEEVLRAGLERFFPTPTPTPTPISTPTPTPASDSAQQPDLQKRAAEGALRSRFFVISGGPGTGKTSTIVKILALLVEQALARNEAPPRMRLVAPTGKAAARLQTSLGQSLASLDCDDAVRAAIPRRAATIHRCLGVVGRSGTRFRHGPQNPLPVDLLLVDEASMVDLSLAAHLVSALPSRARLILLGDRDQLASVEAGSVLGDIGRVEEVRASAADSAVSRPIVHLIRSHRFGPDSGVGELTRRINAGDVEGTLEVLADPRYPEVSLIENDPEGRWHVRLEREIAAGYGPFLLAETPDRRLRALERFRILCPHRGGPAGVDALNLRSERLLARNPDFHPVGPLYPGRPIGVTHNDYEMGLYNGDVGLLARDPAAPERGLRAFFIAPDGTERWLSPLRFEAAETVFALTVHKSQGSEYDAVAVVLPEEMSPILSRELLYTAVSRARQRVCLFASQALLRAGIERRVERSSGLSEALWG